MEHTKTYTTYRTDWGTFFHSKSDVIQKFDEILLDIKLISNKTKLLISTHYHIEYTNEKHLASLFVSQIFENIFVIEKEIDLSQITSVILDNYNQHIEFLKEPSKNYPQDFLESRKAIFEAFLSQFHQKIQDYICNNGLEKHISRK